MRYHRWILISIATIHSLRRKKKTKNYLCENRRCDNIFFWYHTSGHTIATFFAMGWLDWRTWLLFLFWIYVTKMLLENWNCHFQIWEKNMYLIITRVPTLSTVLLCHAILPIYLCCTEAYRTSTSHRKSLSPPWFIR